MYSRISIRNFRGIESLDATGFRRINLIVGRNNAGKTTFLESLLLLGGAMHPLLPSVLGKLRGQRLSGGYPDPVWRPLFHNLDPKTPAEILGYWEEQRREIELKIEAREFASWADLPQTDEGIASTAQESVVSMLGLHSKNAEGKPVASSVYFTPSSEKVQVHGTHHMDLPQTVLLSARAYPSPTRDAQQFSSILKNKYDSDVVDAMRIIEPRVDRIEILSEPSGPAIYLDIGLDALVPLAVCGEGLVRLFSLILSLIESRDGVLLIDEIDNGLHYTVMPSLWKLLGTLAEKHQVQVFGTTHNDDIIRSALETFADEEGMLGLFRIDKRGDQHVMVVYDEGAMQAVREVPFEVRG